MKEKIQQLIASNQTDEAFKQLLSLAKGQLHDDLLVLQARYEKMKRENRLYLASRQELSIDYNQLNDSLLQMVDLVFGAAGSPSVATDNSDDSTKSRWWKWVLALGILISILAGIAQFTGYNLKDFFSPSEAANTVTVLVHGVGGKDQLVLPNRGIVKLVYGDAIVSKQINNEGEATFKQISDVFFDPSHQVEIWFEDPLGESYRAVAPDSAYQLTRGKYVGLKVELLGMDKVFGLVKEFTDGAPISGVVIRVKGEAAISNEYGEFSLDLPKEKQEKFISIQAYKEGYDVWTRNNVPTTTNQEIPILLKRGEQK